MKRKKFKMPKKRDLLLKDLFTNPLYKSKVVPNGKRKKPKHKPQEVYDE